VLHGERVRAGRDAVEAEASTRIARRRALGAGDADERVRQRMRVQAVVRHAVDGDQASTLRGNRERGDERQRCDG
jgi:hypothetical protein